MPNTKIKKLYCYVDETGQDTEGKWFLVVVTILSRDKDKIEDLLVKIERESGKFKTKWHRAKYRQRKKYFEKILETDILDLALYYSIYEDSILFADLIARTTAKAIKDYSRKSYKANIVIDGLGKNLERQFAASVRKLGITTEKVKGARDESSPFIRLADAVAGLLRDNYEKKEWAITMVKKLNKRKSVYKI